MAESTVTVHFPVLVHYYQGEDGQIEVIPSETEEAMERFQWEQYKENAERMAASPNPGDRELSERDILVAEANLARMQSLAEANALLRKVGRTRKVVLKKPSWKRWNEALAQAESIDTESGFTTYNKRDMMNELMDECLPTLGDSEEPLDPLIIYYLWEKLYAAMTPNRDRLFFYQRRSQAT